MNKLHQTAFNLKKAIQRITLKNIKSFIEGYTYSFLLKFYQKYLTHIFEQVDYRKKLVEEKSPECIYNGQCKHCTCKTPELFFATKGCSNNPPCYPEMASKDEWTQFKNLQSCQQ